MIELAYYSINGITKRNARSTFLGCDVEMWYIEQSTHCQNAHNFDPCSFNCIERGSLVRSGHTVEMFKRHVEYEESASQTRHPGYCNR